jgi:hypothetical protein
MKQKRPEQGLEAELNRADTLRTQPVQGTDARQALWSVGVVIAFAIVLGITFYGINARDTQTAASPPANPPALAGESSPATTTGQGGSRESNQRGDAAK